jgi:hypothetical protein
MLRTEMRCWNGFMATPLCWGNPRIIMPWILISLLRIRKKRTRLRNCRKSMMSSNLSWTLVRIRGKIFKLNPCFPLISIKILKSKSSKIANITSLSRLKWPQVSGISFKSGNKLKNHWPSNITISKLNAIWIQLKHLKNQGTKFKFKLKFQVGLWAVLSHLLNKNKAHRQSFATIFRPKRCNKRSRR